MKEDSANNLHPSLSSIVLCLVDLHGKEFFELHQLFCHDLQPRVNVHQDLVTWLIVVKKHEIALNFTLNFCMQFEFIDGYQIKGVYVSRTF